MRTTEPTRVLRDHPSAVLLAVQLVAVLAYPFFDDSPGPGPAGRGGHPGLS